MLLLIIQRALAPAWTLGRLVVLLVHDNEMAAWTLGWFIVVAIKRQRRQSWQWLFGLIFIATIVFSH